MVATNTAAQQLIAGTNAKSVFQYYQLVDVLRSGGVQDNYTNKQGTPGPVVRAGFHRAHGEALAAIGRNHDHSRWLIRSIPTSIAAEPHRPQTQSSLHVPFAENRDYVLVRGSRCQPERKYRGYLAEERKTDCVNQLGASVRREVFWLPKSYTYSNTRLEKQQPHNSPRY